MLFQGYRNRNAFILTQMPLTHTVIDLWRLVYEHKCGTIVMLNPWDENDPVRRTMLFVIVRMLMLTKCVILVLFPNRLENVFKPLPLLTNHHLTTLEIIC